MTQRLMTAAALAAIALVPVTGARAMEPAAGGATTKAAPTTAAQAQHMTAKVTSVNAQAKTLTVTQWTPRQVTFAVSPEAAGSLADLKPGERVRITYEGTAGQLTAQSIAPLTHAAAK